jgi:hypothetical protein
MNWFRSPAQVVFFFYSDVPSSEPFTRRNVDQSLASALAGIGLYVAAYGLAVINVDPSTKLQYLQDTFRQGTVAMIATSVLIAFVTTASKVSQVLSSVVT